MNNVFVVNAGSSSLKYQLIDMDTENVVVSGNCERIGIGGGRVIYKKDGEKKVYENPLPTHRVALDHVVKLMTEGETKVINSMDDIVAVGHRMANGLERYKESTRIDDEAIALIKESTWIAPLHVPAMISGVHACEEIFKGKIQVAVFDNSFHLTMPPKAYIYGIPYRFYEEYGMRRYGYHGTSHRYVSLRLAKLLGKKPEELKIVSCHLGNGSSVCAVDGGRSVDTTMGYTPLSGLMMGTRSGDIDPSLLLHIAKRENLDIDGIDQLLNKESGLLGVSGISSDDRDLEVASADGDKRSQLAQEIVRYQIKKYIGAYAAVMDGLDAIIFTGGIGEHSFILREGVCADMSYFGIKLDLEKNVQMNGKECELSTPDSKVKVWIVPTNEELMIARDTYEIYKANR